LRTIGGERPEAAAAAFFASTAAAVEAAIDIVVVVIAAAGFVAEFGSSTAGLERSACCNARC
jgi:hypothetical protein